MINTSERSMIRLDHEFIEELRATLEYPIIVLFVDKLLFLLLMFLILSD